MMQQSELDRKIDLVITVTGLFMLAVLFVAAGYFLNTEQWWNVGGCAIFGLIVAFALLRGKDERD